MNERDLIVQDEFITGSAAKCKNCGEQLEQIVTRYVEILETILKDSIQSGDFAEALQLFAESAAAMKGTITANSNQIDYDLRSYITAINEADQYLF